ncbi:MAG: cytochrome c-type biogenesis protein CcmH, partial [Acidimicrobiia bacterium]
ETAGSRSIRADIKARVQRGETNQSVLDAYVERFGTSILLEPQADGLNLLLWAVPIGVAIGGSIGVVRVFRRTAASARARARGDNIEVAPRRARVWFHISATLAVVVIGAVVGMARRDEGAGVSTTVTRAQRDSRFLAQLAEYPNSAQLHLAYARFLIDQNEPRALLQFVQAAQLDPKSAEATAYAGWLLYRVDNQVAAARASFDKARGIDENYPDTYFFMGLLEIQQGSADDGRAALQRFLAMAPAHRYAPQARQVLASSVSADKSQTSQSK